jgi:2-keto-4-pentenoate hydratase/2-oxohepta-3-ene-1,7-dioic acid hydratase in catechol pathway
LVNVHQREILRRYDVEFFPEIGSLNLVKNNNEREEMKIAQFIEKDKIRLGLILEEVLQPIDFDGDMMHFLKNGGFVHPYGSALPLSEMKLAPPVSQPSKIVAIGLNYMDHASEGKTEVPKVPLIFAKLSNSIIGSADSISWSNNITQKVDFEAELAVIIGKKVRNCPEEKALEAVFGYTCANDVSARDLQFGDGQWVRGKSLDTFCPIGPWIVTSDEILDPQSLKIESRLNGKIMQSSNTKNMIFPVSFLVSFLSRHFTLFPGDLILTGTPSGVGTFREPSIYMKDGDEIIVSIDKIGDLKNRCYVQSR